MASGDFSGGGALIGYQGVMPELGAGVFVAPGARVIGQVRLGGRASVWYNAVVRGDVAEIVIGAETNVQDNAVLHVDSGDGGQLEIGARVTIGHGAIVHACTIEELVLIGMGAVVLNGAHIETGAMVAAGAVVTPGVRVASGMLYGGVPAKALRELSDAEQAGLAESAAHYVAYAGEHARGLAAGAAGAGGSLGGGGSDT